MVQVVMFGSTLACDVLSRSATHVDAHATILDDWAEGGDGLDRCGEIVWCDLSFPGGEMRRELIYDVVLNPCDYSASLVHQDGPCCSMSSCVRV